MLPVSDKEDFQTKSITKDRCISNDKRVNPIRKYENFQNLYTKNHNFKQYKTNKK